MRAEVVGPTPERSLSEHAQARTRSALTGTIFAMSVLAYLGDHETTLGTAVVTVGGTGVVIFFAEAYAGLLASSLTSVRRLPGAAVRSELIACSTAAAPGLVAGVVLLLTDLAQFTLQVSIDIALWIGVVALTACSIVASRAARRSLAVQAALVAASVAVGGVIVVLKAKLH